MENGCLATCKCKMRVFHIFFNCLSMSMSMPTTVSLALNPKLFLKSWLIYEPGLGIRIMRVTPAIPDDVNFISYYSEYEIKV